MLSILMLRVKQDNARASHKNDHDGTHHPGEVPRPLIAREDREQQGNYQRQPKAGQTKQSDHRSSSQ